MVNYNTAGLTNPMTTAGDLIDGGAAGVPARIAVGSANQVLTVSGGVPSWQNSAAGFSNPMTTAGDIIIENATPAADRLAVGTTGQGLQVSGGGLPAWANMVNSLAATDASIVVAGTALAPTVATGTLDVIAAQHPAAANWSNNSHKITALANGSAASDAAALGQVVNSLAATDTSIVVGGTATAPTVATGTLDVVAAQHAPAANWSNNSHKITSLANGTASTDAAAFGQIPTVWAPADNGYISWAYDPAIAASAGSAVLATAGKLYVTAVPLRVAQNITNIVTILTGNGGTLTSGQCFAALYQGAGGSLLGTTADQATAWGSGAVKVVTMAISGGAVAAAAGILYVAFWFNGTTGPTFFQTNGNATIVNAGLAAASARWGTADTGRTTTAPGTLGTITAATAPNYWAALS